MVDDDIEDQARERLLKQLRSEHLARTEIEKFLVSGKYKELGALTIGEGMSAEEIQTAVEESGRTLCARPKRTAQQITVRRGCSHSGKRAITFSMWTVEDGKPAVSVTYLLSDSVDGECSIAIQSIELESKG